MPKNALAQTFARAVVGGRRYSRSPTDTTPPTAPTLSDPVPGQTTLSLLWTNGTDGETGVKESWVEIRVNGSSTWTRVVVPYVAGDLSGRTYAFSGLTAGTPYDTRVGTVDNAGNVTYSAIKTVSTTGTNPDTQPGAINIAVPFLIVIEGTQLVAEVIRSGGGASSPAVEADWQYTGFSEGAPVPANGTLSWAAAENGSKFALSTAGIVSQDRAGLFRIAAVRALTGSIQPSLGTSQVPVTIRNSTSAGGVKWHPGHYGLLTSTSSYSLAALNAIAATTNVKGVKVGVGWNTIEPTRGNYSRTFLDQLFADCRARNLRVAIEFVDQSFGSGNPVPSYMATEPGANGGFFRKNAGGVETKRYLAPVMDRLIAVMAWIGATYDSEPIFEGIVGIAESAISEGASQSDWTESGYLTQYLRWVSAVPPNYPTTNVWAGLNFGFGNNANYPTITAAMRANRCGQRGPDVWADTDDNSTKGDKAIRGLIPSGSSWVSGGTDSRGVIPIAHDAQGPELGGKENPSSGTSITTLYNQAKNVNKDNHVFWLYKDWTIGPTPPNDLYWDNAQGYATNPLAGSSDIKTFIAAGNPLITTAPSCYASVNTG